MLHRRLVALGSAALAGVVVVPGCRAIVAGDSVDLAAQICSVLSECYGDQDCAAIAAKLPSDDPVTEAFLASFDTACLGACAPLKACLDTPPFCEATLLASCDDETDCCNWSEGQADCVAERCCLPDGVSCGSDEAACCNDNCVEGNCGGYECQKTGDPCDDLAQCCSQLCLDGTCSPKVCADFGQECEIDDDCCPPEITMAEPLTCVEGFCRRPDGPQCSNDGDPCEGDDDCCEGLGLTCIDNGGVTLCGDEQCPGIGDACLDGGVCCFPLDCIAEKCRASACTADGDPCTASLPCCNAGICAGGTCGGGCASVECDHSVCESGGPLDESCDTEEADCIATVLELRPDCGCTQWGLQCRCLAAAACGTCPVVSNLCDNVGHD